MKTGIKKKNIRDVEIGDHVKQTVSTGGKKKCGEVLMILQDNPGDPTLECVEVNPDDLTPLEKGSDGIRTFKAKRSKLHFQLCMGCREVILRFAKVYSCICSLN